MVLASHVILGMYGPASPTICGPAGAEFVSLWTRFSTLTKVNDRRSHAWDEHDHRHREEMKKHLKYPQWF